MESFTTLRTVKMSNLISLTSTDDSLYTYFTSDKNAYWSKTVYMFDLDHTLIKPTNGTKFCKSDSDWTFHNSNVYASLKSLYVNKHPIVVFTNQLRRDMSILQKRLSNIAEKLGFTFDVLVANKDDYWRKPSPCMLKYWKDHRGVAGNSKYIYVGDAAGRSSDFSDSDAAFAYNCSTKVIVDANVAFVTESTFFSSDVPNEMMNEIHKVNFRKPLAIDIYDKYKREFQSLMQKQNKLSDLTTSGNTNLIGTLDSLSTSDWWSGKTIIFMVGPPSCGKSTIARKLVEMKSEQTYTINQDKLGTAVKCLKEFKKYLPLNGNIIIDNTNPDKKTRARYLDALNLYRQVNACRYKVIALLVRTPSDLLPYLNFLRNIETNGEVKKIPRVAYSVYNKKREMVNKTEGFDHIYEYCPDFSFAKYLKLRIS